MRFCVSGRTIQQNNSSIGVQGDNQVEIIEFVVPRFYNEIDLNIGIPYMVYRLPDNSQNQVELEKTLEEESMVFTWIVGSQITKEKGLMKAGLKVSGLNGVLWGSNLTGFIIAESIPFESPQQPIFRMAAFALPQVQSFEAPISGSRTAQPDTEPPITVVERKINIPTVLQTMAVQNDANSETVFIQMPRYFDGNDLYNYNIFLKTILPESGGRDDIVLHPQLRDDTTLIMPWTLKPPQTSYGGALGLQIYVTGVKPDGSTFKWETFDTSVTIATSLDADLFVPTEPSVFEGFIKSITEIERRAKEQAEMAKTSQQAAFDSQQAAHNSQQAALGSQQAAESLVELAALSAENAEACVATAREAAQAAGACQQAAEEAKQQTQSIRDSTEIFVETDSSPESGYRVGFRRANESQPKWTPPLQAQVFVGEVVTLEPSGSASITPRQEGGATLLDFEIPRGEQGLPGPAGKDGVVGMLASGQFAMEIDSEGNLLVHYSAGATPPNLRLENGFLLLEL